MTAIGLFGKRKTLYFKLIVLVTIVIIITVLAISIVTSMIYNRNILENAESYNRALVNRQQKLMDKEMGNIVRIALSVTMAQAYMYSFNETRSDLTVKSLIDLTYYLQKQKNINEYIESIYIYYDEPRRVITSLDQKRTSIVDSYFDNNWLNYITFNNTSDSMWIVDRIKSNINDPSSDADSTVKYVTFIKELPLLGKTNGAVVINIKQSKFFGDYLGNYKNKMGKMFIMDENGSIIYSESPELSEALTSQQPSKFGRDNTFYMDYNGEENIVTCLASNVSGWRYINVIPRSSLINSTSIIRRIILVICLFYIGAAIVISMMISNRIYRPISTLVQYLKNSENEKDQKLPADEVSLIRSAFDRIKQSNIQLLLEKNRIEKILQDNSALMKEKYLNDLTGGRIFNPISISQYLEVFKIQANFKSYAVIIMMIENLHDILSEYNKIEFNLLKYSLMQHISPLINGDAFLKDDDKIIVIQTTLGMNENQIMDLAKMLQNEVSARTNFTVTIGISSKFSGVENMEQAYRDAEKALNQKLYFGKGEILTNRNITGEYNQALFYYPYDLEKKLINAVNQGKQEEVSRLIQSIFAVIADKKLSIANIDQIFFRITSEIMKALASTGENPDDVFGSSFNILEHMSRAQTLIEMENFLLRICSEIISFYDVKRSKINLDVIKLAEKFIQENYNNNISIDSVSDYVSLSTSYLSRIFKETKGKTLNEYIIDVRMDKTIELLKNTDYSIENICHMVGYTNISYFNKIFKARTGTTPGKFRKEYLLSGSGTTGEKK
ncbi:MAG TPA: AraC family transcriptional regulator [Clostridiales bacterium]|nr:AraC family transcriptional regulator [Clostridiales bacterium]